jgi:Bacterial surface proteins containing Ig-like domains
MGYDGKKQGNLLQTSMNIVFYIMLILLIGFILYPHTSFYYKHKIYKNPFAMSLNKSSVVMEVGDYYHLHVNRLNKRIEYSSTDFKVAYVNLNGRIHARQRGTAIIKAKVDDKVLKCKVTVIRRKK